MSKKMGDQIKRLLTNTWKRDLIRSRTDKKQFWRGERNGEKKLINDGINDYEERYSEEDELNIEENQIKWEEKHQQRLMKNKK